MARLTHNDVNSDDGYITTFNKICNSNNKSFATGMEHYLYNTHPVYMRTSLYKPHTMHTRTPRVNVFICYYYHYCSYSLLRMEMWEKRNVTKMVLRGGLVYQTPFPHGIPFNSVQYNQPNPAGTQVEIELY